MCVYLVLTVRDVTRYSKRLEDANVPVILKSD
jgi:hypothetical protein